MAILTIHHWRDFREGIREMLRVTPHRVVIMTWDPDVFAGHFWFARDYLPETQEAERGLATVGDVVAALGKSLHRAPGSAGGALCGLEQIDLGYRLVTHARP